MTRPINDTASPQRVTAAIAKASARTGVDFDYLMDQARIESGMRPDARAHTSSATGLYQFTKQTWLGTVKEHGASHGLDWAANAISKNADGTFSVADGSTRAAILDLRNNPEAAASMAAEFAADNGQYLQARIGTNPEPVDLYLAHFLGAEGAAKFLDAFQENPDQNAAPLFAEAARANQSIFYRTDGSARSLAEIRQNFASKLGNAPSGFPMISAQATRHAASSAQTRAPLEMATMELMPKKLDLNFARNAYRRLSGISA
jgi:hypothetical protein